ncbi:acyl-CoA dehydrogenase family protein [Methylobacterium radiotolerans]|nr:cyclic nucleotide-binding protein [Methylobacterium sp. ME121]
MQLGGIEAVFDAWRGHLAETGRGSDPHQLARLGEGAIAVESARGWVERAARTVTEDELTPERIVALVNLARLAIDRAGIEVLRLAHRSVGLQGFLREHPLERLSRDLATYLRQPAPDRALTTAAAEILEARGAAGDLFEAGAARRPGTSIPCRRATSTSGTPKTRTPGSSRPATTSGRSTWPLSPRCHRPGTLPRWRSAAPSAY